MSTGKLIGLRDIHYALLTSDDESGVVYEDPKRLAEAVSAKLKPKVNTESLFADDRIIEQASSLENVEIELELADLTPEIQAEVLGQRMEKGVVISSGDDIAPYLALGFRALKSNGKFRYVWLYKGKFELPEDEHQTKEGKVSFQKPKIKATFMERKYDSAWKGTADDNTDDFTGGKDWFKAVHDPTPTPEA